MSPERWCQVEKLYHSARERGRTVLTDADPELRREVENLLSQDLGGKILERPVAEHLGESTITQLAGLTVSHYRILEMLGAGGMGVVYKAFDTKLGRLVALKFLPLHMRHNEELKGRLTDEARAASALDHPNIVVIYDVDETADGDMFIAMAFHEGATLRDKLGQDRIGRDKIGTALPVEEALQIARQIASGLAKAHERGIIHRDIKPANVIVAKDGVARIIDFGLAKSSDTTATLDGSTRGTPLYMSPEQASGKALDSRTDLWSLGAVLYEMLAGRPPFSGDTHLQTMHAIVHDPVPRLRVARPDLPSEIERIVSRALEKDPAKRYQSAADMALDLSTPGLQALPSSRSNQSSDLRRRWLQKDSGTRRLLWWAAAGMALLSAVGVVLFRSQTSGGPARLEYTQLTDFADPVVSPALSPDGRLLTFIRGDSTFVGPGEIYVQLLPNGEPVQLTRDRKQKMSPVFSPDGSRIAYTTVNESSDWDTWSVPALGGPPGEFLHNAAGLTWIPSRDGQSRVLFSEITGEGIHMALTASTENRLDARRVYAPANLSGMAHRSTVSPDGRWVLVVEMGSGWLPCRLVPFDGSSLGRVVGPRSAPCTYAAWSPNGEWMYFSANAGNGFHIWRQRFPDGEPEQVTSGATEEQGLAFAPDGRSFVTSIGVEQNTIWVHDSHGERQVTCQGYAYLPKFSPDGKRLYYMLRSGVSTRTWVSGELRVTDLESGQNQRLLSDFRIQDYSLSPDGKGVVFTAMDDTGRLPVWIAALDGRSPPRRLAHVESGRALFGPDGDVFFTQSGFLQRIRADGGGRQKLIQDRVIVLYGLSADGKWAAVWKGKSVAIYPLDGGSPIELCSLCGTVGAENRGITPPVVSWSRDGRFLYVHFAWTTRETYAVPLRSGQILPPQSKGGIPSAEEAAALPGAQRIPQLRAFVGNDPSVYAFMRNTSQRNIYRVPVP
jgi:serine/threonine protein kinase